MKHRYVKQLVGLSFVFILSVMTACGDSEVTGRISGGRDVARLPGAVTSGQIESVTAAYGELAVVTGLDSENSIITLKVIGKRTIELSYSGGTDIRDDIGEAISMTQIQIGEVVLIDYEPGVNKLTGMSISGGEWHKEVSGVNVKTKGAYVEYKGDKYTYDDNLVVISDGARCEIEDIEQIDELLIKGRDKKIDSIIVMNGHGYLQLKDTNFYEGGIIEVGNKVITEIKPEMKLLVPEGTYRLTVTKDKNTGSKEITVKRGSEQVVSLLQFQSEGQRNGNIAFVISPDGANLYIDKKQILDYSKMVEVTYGEHEIVVTADGYKTFTRTVNIDSVYTPMEIELEEIYDDSEESTDAGSLKQTEEVTAETAAQKSDTNTETKTEIKTETTTKTNTEATTVNLTDIVSGLFQ